MPRKARWNSRSAEISSNLIFNWHEASTPETGFFRGITHLASLPQALVEELRALSINDWYGWGVLVGLGLEEIITDAQERRAFHYAGRTVCRNSYLEGLYDGRQMKRVSAKRPLCSEQPPEEGGDSGPDPTPQ